MSGCSGNCLVMIVLQEDLGLEGGQPQPFARQWNAELQSAVGDDGLLQSLRSNADKGVELS